MLTSKGSEALTIFLDRTHAIIVSRTFSDMDWEVLDVMLRDWRAEPTEQKEQAIINQFAITGERNGPEPGPDY